MEGKLLELLYIKNDFATDFAKCHYLFRYFVSHIMVIPRYDTFLYCKANQIPLWYILLQNVFFLAPE